MDRLEITEKIIKEILSKRENMISSIHARIQYLSKDISQTSDIIEAVSLRSKALSDMPRGGGGHKDLFAEYEKYQQLLDHRYSEYSVGIRQLRLQEERIERVWLCFNALDTDAYTILYRLYVNKELYQTVERESGLTHPVFEKLRKRAMLDIMRLYNSELEDRYIFEVSETEHEKSQMGDDKKTDDNYQISFADLSVMESKSI